MSFFFIPWTVALLLSLPAGILGCFIFWRRIAFFSDALAHSSILGLALAFIFHFNQTLGIFCLVVLFAFLITVIHRQQEFATDAMLSISAHFFLGLGVLLITLAELRVDLLSYLLGEWLLLDYSDIYLQGCVSLIILGVLWLVRKPFLSLVVQDEIAQAEGIVKKKFDLIFFLLLASFIAAAVQTVGLLLLNTLMIMPAATARGWVKTPYTMFALSILIALIIMTLGLLLSFQFDVPASPAAAVVGGVLFFLSRAVQKFLPTAKI